MIQRKPEGYKQLLAYKKAVGVQEMTLKLTNLFPRTKNMLSLKDQMDRSARSGTKNIIEGWKRNTTGEYFHFLGYSIGSVEELKDDCADIAKGLYRELMGVRGLMGSRLTPLTPFELESLRFYPLDETLPSIVQLYLKCKELLMLLNKLQQSLDLKMDSEMTKSVHSRSRERFQKTKHGQDQLKTEISNLGLVRLASGQFISKSEFDSRTVAGEKLELFNG